MKYIDLTKGKLTLVDDCDYEELNKHKWFAGRSHEEFYATRKITVEGKQETLWMHRVIIDAPKGMQVDHRNVDGLDNRRCNLRLCTNSQNAMNRRRSNRNKSGYKGVSWNNRASKWAVYICVKRKNIHCGYFTCLIKAAKAYDKAAREYFGEFANTNFKEAPLK